jgi:hypothetical protein
MEWYVNVFTRLEEYRTQVNQLEEGLNGLIPDLSPEGREVLKRAVDGCYNLRDALYAVDSVVEKERQKSRRCG